MLDDLNELKTFRAILAEGSLSAAARRLGVTLAVVSKRLATLETRAGVRLVNRTTRALSPTDDGARLLVEVRRALEAIEAGEIALAGGRHEPRGLLRVSAPVSLGRRHVAPVLGSLSAAYADLEVDLRLEDRVADFVAEGVDVVIRIGGLADSSSMMRKLADNRRVLVASPAYLDRVGRPVTLAHARELAFIRYAATSTPWRLFGPGGETTLFDAPAKLRVDSGEVMHDWAREGLGVAIKSLIDVAEDLAFGRLERVLPDWDCGEAPVVALFASAHNLPLKTRVFLDAIQERASAAMARARDPVCVSACKSDPHLGDIGVQKWL